jgi:hypothetical protein
MSKSPEEQDRDMAIAEINDLLAGLGDSGVISMSHRHLEILGKLPLISKEDEESKLGSNRHKGGGGGRDVYVQDVRKAFKKVTAGITADSE